MHHIPYSKPDLEYHNNSNTNEIEYHLSENDFDFFKNFQEKLQTLTHSPEVRVHKVHKVIHPYSKVLGPPYPEKIFVRHKISLLIKNNPIKTQSNRTLSKCLPKSRSTPTRSSL